MLKKYAPKTWESVPAENWELCKYNGEIYLMPEDNYAQWVNHGFIVNDINIFYLLFRYPLVK